MLEHRHLVYPILLSPGYVIGMIPSQIALTKVRPGIYIPICELIWTVLTCFLALAKTAKQVMGLRFLIGLSESVFYPAVHLILGSWYKPSELGKRAGIIYAVGSAAGMFTGYLQIAAYNGLNGKGGKHGWQWLFIINAVISFPIALAGFWLYPDYPHNTKAFYLKDKDKALAIKRMQDVGRAPYSRFNVAFIKKLFSTWHIYALSVLYIIFSNNGSSNSINPLTLWLLSRHWSVTKLVSIHTSPRPTTLSFRTDRAQNVLPSAQAAIQLVASVVFSIASDTLRNRPIILTVVAFLGLLSSIILAIWNVPIGLKWFALFLNRAAVPFGPLSLTWTNEICGGNAEERAIIIGVMNALGYAFNAWLPVLTYPQTDAPKFHFGWRFSCGAFCFQIAAVWVVNSLYRRDLGRKLIGAAVKEAA